MKPKTELEQQVFDVLSSKLETFEIRFTARGLIITKNPLTERFNVVNKNHLKLMVKEWYREAGFPLKGKKLDDFACWFIDACCSETKKMIERGLQPETVVVVNKKI